MKGTSGWRLFRSGRPTAEGLSTSIGLPDEAGLKGRRQTCFTPPDEGGKEQRLPIRGKVRGIDMSGPGKSFMHLGLWIVDHQVRGVHGPLIPGDDKKSRAEEVARQGVSGQRD